jgi:hypothetical protein
MVTPEVWKQWINVLEDMLHEADVGQASMFAIHIDSAIVAAHAALGTERFMLKSDPVKGDQEIS